MPTFLSDLVVDRMDDAFRARREYERGIADFSDYYIGQMNHTLNAETTYTFDQKAGAGRRFSRGNAVSMNGLAPFSTPFFFEGRQ